VPERAAALRSTQCVGRSAAGAPRGPQSTDRLASSSLGEDGPQPYRQHGPGRARVVLDVDDPAVPEREGLCPPVSRAVLVRPRERDDDPLAPLLDRIDATVVAASRDRAGDASRENLAGLGRSVSGRWVPPQAPGGSAATPLQLGVDEPHERLDVAGHERLVGGTRRVKHHVGSIDLSTSWIAAVPRRRPEPVRHSCCLDARLRLRRAST
jgi:hypothetical protein